MTQAVGVPDEAVAQMRQQPMWKQMEKLAHTLPYDGAVVGRVPQNPQQRQERWASVKVPTLVIDGETSDAHLRNAVQSLSMSIPGAERRTLVGQDHSAPFVAPQTFVEVLVAFFLESR
jgi:pimeloyl-ACP methyl ester carboxylesterase